MLLNTFCRKYVFFLFQLLHIKCQPSNTISYLPNMYLPTPEVDFLQNSVFWIQVAVLGDRLLFPDLSFPLIWAKTYYQNVRIDLGNIFAFG